MTNGHINRRDTALVICEEAHLQGVGDAQEEGGGLGLVRNRLGWRGLMGIERIVKYKYASVPLKMRMQLCIFLIL